VEALVQFAGGHDPGPIEIAPPEDGQDQEQLPDDSGQQAPPSVPQEGSREPGAFLPGRPPIELGAPPDNPLPGPVPGPWGPPRRN
jgi:heat shock protein HtpX